MDTKSKKYNRGMYWGGFVLCTLGFLVAVLSFMAFFLIGINNTYGDPKQGTKLSSDMPDWCLIIAVSAVIVTLTTFVYLAVNVGRRPWKAEEKDPEAETQLNFVDKIFSELQILLICVIFVLCGMWFLETSYGTAQMILYGNMGPQKLMSPPSQVESIIAILVGIAATGCGLTLLLSCIKKIKTRQFISQSICGWFYHAVFKSGTVMRKAVILAILLCFLAFTRFLIPAILVILLVLIPRWIRQYEIIRMGLNRVNNGDLDYKIDIPGDNLLAQLAQGINQISQAASMAVQSEIKNQRMKTDLISNVSHDLRTPLTSMVAYLDLLQSEGLDSPKAPEYVQVLEKRTKRLNRLTDDLFEAAKASSGAIPVEITRLDVLSLINQAMGELNQKIKERNLEFIVEAKEDHYDINADGQLLWRVTANLLGNAIKYSQEGTRVYIEVRRSESEMENLGEEAGKTYIEIKNISQYALNTSPEVLTERFRRGDEARATEGSGLGLAIATDLTALMGGVLTLSADGDLFKACLCFPSA